MAEKDKQKARPGVPATQAPIIVKKIKKGGHGFHGGSWKVAYADFVTAMMAFFLLMWLINMAPQDKRIKLASFFRHYSVFSGGKGPAQVESKVTVTKQIVVTKTKEVTGKTTEQAPPEEKKDKKPEYSESEPVKLKEIIQATIDLELEDVKDQVLVELTKEGIKIQVVEKEGKPIFDTGNDKLTNEGKKILKTLSAPFKYAEKQIVIEGHMDAAPFKSGRETNWDLSSLRASAARRELVSDGVSSDQFSRVTGFADKSLLFPEQPFDPRNRRLAFIMLNPLAKEEAKEETTKKEEPKIEAPKEPEKKVEPEKKPEPIKQPEPVVTKEEPAPKPVEEKAPPPDPLAEEKQKAIEELERQKKEYMPENAYRAKRKK